MTGAAVGRASYLRRNQKHSYPQHVQTERAIMKPISSFIADPTGVVFHAHTLGGKLFKYNLTCYKACRNLRAGAFPGSEAFAL